MKWEVSSEQAHHAILSSSLSKLLQRVADRQTSQPHDSLRLPCKLHPSASNTHKALRLPRRVTRSEHATFARRHMSEWRRDSTRTDHPANGCGQSNVTQTRHPQEDTIETPKQFRTRRVAPGLRHVFFLICDACRGSAAFHSLEPKIRVCIAMFRHRTLEYVWCGDISAKNQKQTRTIPRTLKHQNISRREPKRGAETNQTVTYVEEVRRTVAMRGTQYNGKQHMTID